MHSISGAVCCGLVRDRIGLPNSVTSINETIAQLTYSEIMSYVAIGLCVGRGNSLVPGIPDL